MAASRPSKCISPGADPSEPVAQLTEGRLSMGPPGRLNGSGWGLEAGGSTLDQRLPF